MSAKRRPWSLRRRMVTGLLAYLMLLTVGVLANDYVVNETAEALVWESLLGAEMAQFLQRREAEPGYRWQSTQTLELFDLAAGGSDQPDLRALTPGVHDEIMVNDRQRVLLVKDAGDRRYVLALDITELEAREARFRQTVFASAFVSVVLLGLLAAWGVDRLSRPFRQLAEQIRALDPEGVRRRVEVPQNASSELALIAEAMNAYCDELQSYIEREREFIATASHELRTPLSIFAGAVNLALIDPTVSPSVSARLQRAQGTIVDVQELVALLLVLAKNPEKLSEANEQVSLQQLIPDIVEEHLPLAQGKELEIVIGQLLPGIVLAPGPMVRSAIGNLVRNAIEGTHAGTVTVSMSAADTVVIENPAPQIPPAELAAIYTRLARGANRDGGGIGLPLIARLSRHCGWSLQIADAQASGIRFSLRFATG